MKIVIIGDQENYKEAKEKFGEKHECILLASLHNTTKLPDNTEVIFDFVVEENIGHLEIYESLPDISIFLNTVKISLAELYTVTGLSLKKYFGFNGLKTFFNRPVLEVSSLAGFGTDRVFEQLSTEYCPVADRVGLVTPRVVLMIINEAHFTVQESTAAKADIDLGMKLGTNYPFGPFEWADKIGIKDVYETLDAIYEDTHDERYKICPMIKTAYLLAQ